MTGSGVTIEVLVAHGARLGVEQRVIVGLPAGAPVPSVGGLSPDHVRPLFFGGEELPFLLPGMSDVMPYPSTRFSDLDTAMVARYEAAWGAHVASVAAELRPDLVHAHHVWLLSAVVRSLLPEVPLVVHCHGTGLRQAVLCPHLAPRVRAGCARADALCALHADQAAALVAHLGVPSSRIHVVGAGFREDLFHSSGRRADVGSVLVYAGKLAHAKGLPQLLDAVERLARSRPGLHLHVCGDASGPEADALRARMIARPDLVTLHGQVDQPRLADILRQAAVFVLPSFYEGLPLVVVEALAAGCRAVVTELPGLRDGLAPLASALHLVPCPPLIGADVPAPVALPAFAAALEHAILEALDAGPHRLAESALAAFGWSGVGRRVEGVWRALAPASEP